MFGIRLRGAISDAGGANPEYDWTDVETIRSPDSNKTLILYSAFFSWLWPIRRKPSRVVTAANREQKAADLFTALLKNRSEDPLAWYAHSVVLKQYRELQEVGLMIRRWSHRIHNWMRQFDWRPCIRRPRNLPVWLAAGTRAISAGNIGPGEALLRECDQGRTQARGCLPATVSNRLRYGGRCTEQQDNRTQHRDAVAILKSGLQVSELSSNVLLKVELLRHQLRLVDSESQAEAAGTDSIFE